MKNSITVQITDGIIEIGINKNVAIDTTSLIRMQTQEGWETGLSRVISRLLDPLASEVQKELEQTLHQTIIYDGFNYKVNE